MTAQQEALHYSVIANTAHKIEKVASKLSDTVDADYVFTNEVNKNKQLLHKYVEELIALINK